MSGDDCQPYEDQAAAEAACIAAADACGGVMSADSGHWQIRAGSVPMGAVPFDSYVKYLCS